MTNRRWTGTWIGGVPAAGADLGRPGERLGLPESGPGALSGLGRRLGALIIDWLACMLIVQGLAHWSSWATLALFAAENMIFVATLGSTLGMRILGIGVRSADGGVPNPLMAAVRAVLLCFVVPAVIWDRDRRGMHDRASATVVVRL